MERERESLEETKEERQEECRSGSQELFVRIDRARKKGLTEGLEEKRRGRLWQTGRKQIGSREHFQKRPKWS